MTDQWVECNPTEKVFILFLHLKPQFRMFKAAIVALNTPPKRENAGLLGRAGVSQGKKIGKKSQMLDDGSFVEQFALGEALDGQR
jgi:hypothetical protein